MYNLQPDPRVSFFQFGCKRCPTCGYLNAAHASWCGAQWCGSFLGVFPTTIQEAAKQGIKICPHCGDWYSSWAWFCKRCACPLQDATYSLPVQPLNPYQEEVPCPKCSKSKPQTPFCDYCGRLVAVRMKIIETLSLSKHVINLQLGYGNTAIYCPVLIDSGASTSLFHGYVAGMLGINLSYAPHSPIGGITPGSGIAYATPLTIMIANKAYQIPASFSYDLARNAYNMLGVVGFFDRFTVSFEEENIVIGEKKILHVKYWRYCPTCGSERQHRYSDYCGLCGASLKVEPVLTNQFLPQAQQQAFGKIIHLHEYRPLNTAQGQY